MKRVLSTIIICLILSVPASAELINIYVTGWSWLQLDQEQKLAIVEGFFSLCELDRAKYSPEKAVFSLDTTYSEACKRLESSDADSGIRLEAKLLLDAYVLTHFYDILNDTKSDRGIKSFEKES